MKLLIVEDDAGLSGILARGLKEEQFDVVVAEDGESGLSAVIDNDFDCVILDVMLPGLDGFSLCRRLREKGRKTPVLMLTVKNAVEDKVAGLSAGADDYLAKPFAFTELLARIHALIRRRNQYADHHLHYQDLELDLFVRKAVRAGRVLDLTPKEFVLLEHLMRNTGRIVSEKELIETVWGLSFDPQTNIVNVYFHHLRKKIDQEGLPRLIHTVRGRGFLLGKEP